MNDKVKKNKYGYYQLKNKPTKKELSDYYSNIYYQKGKSSYEVNYSDNEIKYIKSKQKYLEYCLDKININKFENINFLDIGSGEGWTLNHFKNLGCNIKGVDFSSYGMEKFNPQILDCLLKTDIYEFIKEEQKSDKSWDIIHIGNVIEHVLAPEILLNQIKNMLSSDGIIICTFPNDFSEFQTELMNLEKITNEFWISIPDHISYFNKTSFEKLVISQGLKSKLTFSDFSIDFFLMNDHSNYIKDSIKGKQAHISRILLMNFLSKQNFKLSAEIFIKFGEMGFGRNLTVFLEKQS